MNDLLELKGKFEQRTNPSRGGGASLRAGAVISSNYVKQLIKELNYILEYWKDKTLIDGVLISVKYNKLAAKSNRINGIFRDKTLPNDKVVGAKYSDDKKHIITYYMPLETLKKSIDDLICAKDLLNQKFDGNIDNDKFNNKELFENLNGITKTLFREIIADIAYVEKFTIEEEEIDENSNKIVTLYKTNRNIKELLESIGIKIFKERILDETTVLLNMDDIKVLNQKVPYLISMAVIDFNETYLESSSSKTLESEITIPSPKNEPTIGVIDTLFDDKVYFNEWVEFEQVVSQDIDTDSKDYNHGTAVSSIIVDGPKMNPWLDDGCGRFKVKHFGVALNRGFNSFTIVKEIEQIIIKNRDIKVWNLSLGSKEEIHNNFISAEAAILDKIQYENDVIFVIAGTNKAPTEENKQIGAPADSINALVVNSVERETKESTNYTREGLVLSFFIKPDVSYYGGDSINKISVCEPLGKFEVSGTSFAAPWISRKLAYLINVMGFNREIAKSLIIDSAIGWEQDLEEVSLKTKGHGVVPIHIDDIVKSKEDEIKFVVSGTSELYDTYNYRFPVPVVQEKHPFISRATLCYFPKCSRVQGVDYTNTELDILFGRLSDKGNIVSINKNNQTTEGSIIYEQDARKLFRKWDTVKHITDKKSNNRAKKSYENKLWGLSIKTKERLSPRDGVGIKFGVVITLKEINGINRIDDFIKMCSFNGWVVNKINVENKIDMYQKINEEIELE